MPLKLVCNTKPGFLVLFTFFFFLLTSCATKERGGINRGNYGNMNSSALPFTKYEGIIRNIDIKVEKLAQGWNISLKNNLWASELSVWFDDEFQGTIERANEYPEKYVWKTFFTSAPVKRVVVGVVASPYEKDIGRAWYKDIN